MKLLRKNNRFTKEPRKNRFLGFLGVAAITVLFSSWIVSSSNAAVTATDLNTKTCNPSYYESLKSQAWLETQRRMRQAQNYIFKPDSILDYSCFPIENNVAGKEVEEIFSEYHAGHCFPEALDCALQALVMQAVVNYQSTNFGHTFLGGHSSISRPAYDMNVRTMCTVMKDVWDAARCRNFATDINNDGFLNMKDYATIDPRTLPTACSNNVAADWNNHIANAYQPTVSGNWYTPMKTASTTNETNFDQYVEPGDAASTGCGPIIKTGLIVKDDYSIFFKDPKTDYVCANPACTPSSMGASAACILMTF